MKQEEERNRFKRAQKFGLPLLAGVMFVLGQAVGPQAADAGTDIEDISPTRSLTYPTYVAGASGGRVNNLAEAPNSNQVFYAATEWGGVWKTEDGGYTWRQLQNHVPVATWDVAVDPLDANTVYATSAYDGRVDPVSGIQVSHDAGETWAAPLFENPPTNCVDEQGHPQQNPDQWSGLGIAIQPDAPENVFIGTSCGLAISHDSGDTWTFVDPCVPSPGGDLRNCHAGKSYVWDVAVQGGGVDGKAIVDVCGAEGHSRSTDGGATWEPHNLPYGIYDPYTFATGRCSIAVSPEEPYVVFVVDDITDPMHEPSPGTGVEYGHFAWESDNQGRNWVKLGKPACDSARTKRLTFLTTNDRSSGYNLWYGEVGFKRVECETPDFPVEPPTTTIYTLRCRRAWDNSNAIPDPRDPIPIPCDDYENPLPPDDITYQWWPSLPAPPEPLGAHGDSGDMAFDRTVSVDACPALYASDGGVFIATAPPPPDDCQSPRFTQPTESPRALWLWGMAGSNTPDGNVALQFGVQDNGSWATPTANLPTYTWEDGPTADSFSRVADPWVYLWNDQDIQIKAASPGVVGTFTPIDPPEAIPPSGPPVNRKLAEFGFIPKIAQYGSGSYAVLTDYIDLDGDGRFDGADEKQKVFITDNVFGAPIPWVELDQNLPPGRNCGVAASPAATIPSVEPVFFLLNGGDCGDGLSFSHLYKHIGDDPTIGWEPVVGKDGETRVGIFAVDPQNPQRLYASFRYNSASSNESGMYFSTNGGDDWTFDPELTDLMVGKGLVHPGMDTFHLMNTGGINTVYAFRAWFWGYAQPTLVAYDPDDPDYIVAGGWNSGLFLSTNGGQDWGLLSDPVHPTVDTPHIPEPRYAHFKHDASGNVWLYIGTRGRGVWRIRVKEPIADAGGPYTTPEGQDVALSAAGSSDPDGDPLTYAWDLDDDGNYDDAFVVDPVFQLVGQDGVYPVSVKVSAGGVFSIASTTVTVTNVAPSVSVGSDAPVEENSPVTVSGVVTDPGWLEDLTASIDWGDGSVVQPITGVLENERPDATLTFSISHVYGDNGTFAAQVCGHDDDTLTCTTLALQIDNVNPVAEIDESTAVLVHGLPTFIGEAGEPIDFAGRCTDPGSDDLLISWEWDDGSPVTSTMYLVNPPNPDPFPSPSVQPRDVIDEKTHTYGDACLYEIGFGGEDDDAGVSATDSATVIIVGNAERARSTGYWMHQYRGKGQIEFEIEDLECFLEIAGYMSLIFEEENDASTIERAFDVLFLGLNQGDRLQKFDCQLLTVWLNFASGGVTWDEMVDTDFDNLPDTPLLTAVEYAESVRLDPTASQSELDEQWKILHKINH